MYNKVIITRDVYFNQEEIFNRNTEILKCDIKNMSLEYLVKIIKKAIRMATTIILLTIYNDTVKDFKWSYNSEGNKKKIRPLKYLVPAWRNKYIITVFDLLPTPPNTPLKCLFTAVLIMAMPKKVPSKSLLSVWEYKFKLV